MIMKRGKGVGALNLSDRGRVFLGIHGEKREKKIKGGGGLNFTERDGASKIF